MGGSAGATNRVLLHPECQTVHRPASFRFETASPLKSVSKGLSWVKETFTPILRGPGGRKAVWLLGNYSGSEIRFEKIVIDLPQSRLWTLTAGQREWVSAIAGRTYTKMLSSG